MAQSELWRNLTNDFSVKVTRTIRMFLAAPRLYLYYFLKFYRLVRKTAIMLHNV